MKPGFPFKKLVFQAFLHFLGRNLLAFVLKVASPALFYDWAVEGRVLLESSLGAAWNDLKLNSGVVSFSNQSGKSVPLGLR